MDAIRNALGGNKDSSFSGEGAHLADANSRSTAGEGSYLSSATGRTGHDSLGGNQTTEGVASNVPGAFPDVSGSDGRGSTGYGDNRSGLRDEDSSRLGGTTGSGGYDETTSRTGYGDTDTSRTGYGDTTTSTLADRTRGGGSYGDSSDNTRGYASTDTNTTGARDTPSTIRDDSTPAVGNTYTERKYDLASGASDLPGSTYDSSRGPHHTDTANRLDPNISGSGLGSGSGYGDTTSKSYGDTTTSGSYGDTSRSTTGAGGLSGRGGDDTYGSSSTSRRDDDNTYGSSSTRRDDDNTYGSSTRRDDDDTKGSSGYGSKTGYAAGGAAAGAAGAYGASEYTSKNDDLGPASNTAGPHKSDTLNKADPRVQDDPAKARDLTMDLKRNERGEDQIVVTGADVDRDYTVSEERRADRKDTTGDDDYDDGKEKKSTGKKILGVFGIGKDKNKDKDDTSLGDAYGSKTTDDYSGSRDNDRYTGAAAGAATGGAAAYGASEYASKNKDTDAYGSSKNTESSSYGKSDDYSSSRRDNTDDYTSSSRADKSDYTSRDKTDDYTSSSRRDNTDDYSSSRRDDNDDNDGTEKKRSGISSLLHRDNPNKLHKDPPEGYRSSNTDSSRGDNSGKHYGIDGEIGRSREVSGYQGGDARETTNVDDIVRDEGRNY